MKKILLFMFSLLNLIALAGCQSSTAAESANVSNFTNTAVEGLKEKAQTFTNEEYQAGDVPLNEFVKISGVITKTDGDEAQIVNGDRLMIENDGYQYQIFNQQDTPLKIGDTITVYGEYYGFVKGALIEKEQKSD